MILGGRLWGKCLVVAKFEHGEALDAQAGPSQRQLRYPDLAVGRLWCSGRAESGEFGVVYVEQGGVATA
jgi:hypothetical protein